MIFCVYDSIDSLFCVIGDTGPEPGGACLGRTFLNDLKQPLRLRLSTALALAEM